MAANPSTGQWIRTFSAFSEAFERFELHAAAEQRLAVTTGADNPASFNASRYREWIAWARSKLRAKVAAELAGRVDAPSLRVFVDLTLTVRSAQTGGVFPFGRKRNKAHVTDGGVAADFFDEIERELQDLIDGRAYIAVVNVDHVALEVGRAALAPFAGEFQPATRLSADGDDDDVDE